MEPIFFEPVYKDVIWGGNKIKELLGRNVEGENIGESWEVSAHPNGINKIINDTGKKENLLDLFNNLSVRKEVFGNNCMTMDRFPILVKFIDANKNLSIQVHPGNDYAAKYENDSGKNEVWYIMESTDNAKIIYGFKENVTKDNLKEAVENNIENNVNFVNIQKGDFISIPAGTIHAIGEGIVLCEVQKSSDVTYRVYDWNRVDKNGKPRELHKEKALDVIDLESKSQIHNYSNIERHENIYVSDTFNIDIEKIDENMTAKSDPNSFFVYIVLEGKGKLECDEFSKELYRGSVFLIPAYLGEFKISGSLKVMKVYIS